MWRFGELLAKYDYDWIRHRFGYTTMFDDDGIIYSLSDSWSEDGPYYGRWFHGGDEEVCPYEDMAHLWCGVPEHGWVERRSNGSPMLIERRAYNKWKWGWQPEEDTMNDCWRELINPHHSTAEQFFDLNRGGAALSFNYARNGSDFYHNDVRVGRVDDNEVHIFSDCDFVTFDSLLTIPTRIIDETAA